MSKVFFCNSEAIDLNAIAIMGVSVKTRDNPIGYFGTGLKFSIATLLRTSHKVKLTLARESGERTNIEFVAVPTAIRGETFQQVRMSFNGGTAWQDLGFTTQLGRNWKPWQAYRELYCNCTDEGGIISADEAANGEWGTTFEVEGDGIALAHKNRRQIFLSTAPIFATEDCEIHPGETHDAFYRGVKAHWHSQHAMFTYNIVEPMELTEDRTLKYGFLVNSTIADAITKCSDEDLIETALLAERGTVECNLDYAGCGKPSLAFMDVAFRLRSNAHCNRSAIKLWEKHSDVRLTYTEAELDIFEQQQIDAALALVSRLGADVRRDDFIVVESLGESIYGQVRGSRILIAKATLDMGVRFTASTIYEEWLHKTQRLADESRALQNLLFEKLFTMTEKVCALEALAKRQVAA